MNAQKVAQLFGWVFIVVGVLGFLPIAIIAGSMGMQPSMMFGLFPVNVVHNVVHLAFGIWGVTSAGSAEKSLNYCKIGGAIYLLVGVLGLLTWTATGFGLIPLGGNNVWLHLVIGLALSYFGFGKGAAPAAAEGAAVAGRRAGLPPGAPPSFSPLAIPPPGMVTTAGGGWEIGADRRGQRGTGRFPAPSPEP